MKKVRGFLLRPFHLLNVEAYSILQCSALHSGVSCLDAFTLDDRDVGIDWQSSKLLRLPPGSGHFTSSQSIAVRLPIPSTMRGSCDD
ncbi:MAG TPA: hypothetical protein VK638_14360 [Edaphobacter sp.]|nr:hypothetical protein [Edaphobacter sp.]